MPRPRVNPQPQHQAPIASGRPRVNQTQPQPLAQGGIIQGNVMTGGGERGRETVIPLHDVEIPLCSPDRPSRPIEYSLDQLRAMTVDQLVALRHKVGKDHMAYWDAQTIIREIQDRKFLESFAVFAEVINKASEKIQGGLIFQNQQARVIPQSHPLQTQITSQPYDPQLAQASQAFQAQADEYYDGPPEGVN